MEPLSRGETPQATLRHFWQLLCVSLLKLQRSCGYGTTHAPHVSLLWQAERYQETVSHPCWPVGYNKSLLLSSTYDSPCTEKERPRLALNSTVTLVGTGNGNLCALHVSKLFDFINCSFSRCSFDGVFQPEVSGNFIVSPGTEEGGDRAASWAGCPWLPSIMWPQSQTPSSATMIVGAHHTGLRVCS